MKLKFADRMEQFQPGIFNVLDDKKKELAAELQRLISLLHMSTSIYNIEAREGTDGKLYIMEVSPRGGGNCLAEITGCATGVDMIANAVRAALGMSVDRISQVGQNGFWALYVIHSAHSGIFSALEVKDEAKPFVKVVNLWVKRGDNVNAFSAANASLGTIFLCFDSLDRQQHFMSSPDSFIRVVLQ